MLAGLLMIELGELVGHWQGELVNQFGRGLVDRRHMGEFGKHDEPHVKERSIADTRVVDHRQHPLHALGWTNAPIEIVGGARISSAALMLVCVTCAVYAALHLFLRFTAWGIRMRAAGQNPLLAAQRGIRLHGIYALAWALATFTGGLAGMLVASDLALDQTMIMIGLKAFPAALVGGLDSLAGALLGALIVAAAEVLAIHYISPLLADVVPFFVLLAFLVVRPWGLFGSKEELDRV